MKHYHCPVNGWDCPYYKNYDEKDPNHRCLCTMEDPYRDCDDFYGMYGDCDPEDYTDDDEMEE